MLRTEQEVAEKIRKSLSWLQHMRQTGGGPPYLKIGHAVRYRDEDVDAWLEAQVRTFSRRTATISTIWPE
jgi:predicted DNA-binding transcriptional regulator AlpA